MALHVNGPWGSFFLLCYEHLNSFYFNNKHKNQRDKVSIFVSVLL